MHPHCLKLAVRLLLNRPEPPVQTYDLTGYSVGCSSQYGCGLYTPDDFYAAPTTTQGKFRGLP